VISQGLNRAGGQAAVGLNPRTERVYDPELPLGTVRADGAGIVKVDAEGVPVTKLDAQGAGVVQLAAMQASASARRVFSPRSLGLEVWLRADIGITTVGGAVSVWANEGTAGGIFDFSQSVTTRRPTFNASDANFGSQPTLTGDGGDWLETSGSPTNLDLADGDDFTVLVVLRRTVAVGLDGVVGTSATTDPRFSLEPRVGGNSRITMQAGNGQQLVSIPRIFVDTVTVMRAQVTGAVSPALDAVQGFVDGTASVVSNHDHKELDVGASGREWEVLGAFSGGLTGAFNGQVAEVWMTKRLLTPLELTEGAEYLNTRYGLSVPAI
jgi:hypothetical protein